MMIWVSQWKKINPGINIQVQEVSISRKRQTLNDLSIAFNNTSTISDLIFKKTSTAGFNSECKEHMQNLFNKVIKIIGLFFKIKKFLLKTPLITTQKSL